MIRHLHSTGSGHTEARVLMFLRLCRKALWPDVGCSDPERPMEPPCGYRLSAVPCPSICSRGIAE